MKRRSKVFVCRDEEIATARCRLRYPDESDIEHIWSASQTPNFNDGLAWDPPSSMAEIREPLQRAQESWISGDEYSWTIESRKNGDFVGWISIRRESGDTEWSLGFWIHPTEQGKGFAAECAAAVLEFGFSRVGAKVITAAHAAWNTASSRVLRQIGMQHARTNPSGPKNNGEQVEWLEYEARTD
ncbi:MAG: GNAT family N-acetyltransferase [Woeseiaceae bacterium]